ncbi:protein translocase subunit yidC [Nitrobacter hamburgensis X14]|uniref:Membrane protein insertase YidC n=2 Tax=Nitrobacter hamburgensis TaxID=912 RepID=YIDC_NITHX|nr:RecName: Full=Membrane protein insertase YidC; AltName: Full=Foldase YidC; AltName: Full=Membrane integrase YidC; AltName: Full=Membrane protein YidC [Nitrobacter hamburgensis X14]ABE64429.1 protein translocase subunit yidC [Nitrobacter hamburgensis X14]
MMSENRNTIIAIVLSGLILIAWQYFYNIPQMEKDRAAQQAQSQTAKSPTEPTPNSPKPDHPAAESVVARGVAIATTPRVKIDTPRLSGSISLKGARIDDLLLTKFRETVDPASPAIELFSPSGTTTPYYAEFGWVAATGSTARVPDQNTVWQQEGSGALTQSTPVTLKYDNGEGLTFRRTIAVDDHYLFTIKDEVTNAGGAPVTLYPFALISRHGTPAVSGYYILHEGLIGYLGDQKLQEYSYKKIDEAKSVSFKVTNGWLGITDKYWAAALLPDTSAQLQARFSSNESGSVKTYQADYLEDAQTIPVGGTGSVNTRLFAGAKEAGVVGINFPFVELGGYNKQLGLNHFDLLIDWGWFYFITKPMFLALDFFFHVFGNFGIAILFVTVLIKAIFFPLANRSYASMAKMKAVQPQIAALKERFPDDKMKLQQEMMEIYKKEKINPISGCLPMVLQIPVFFSLYKVLFVTIEMRHAPFFAWIKDLSAPDPTHIFNLFGLLPYDPSAVPLLGPYLAIGAWPIIMGITMWFQMKLNPTPPDPTQKLIFDWMPVIFTFMLAAFPAGLVIYWAWNNTLSVIQQSYIMRRNGVKVELLNNVKSVFRRKSSDKPAKT